MWISLVCESGKLVLHSFSVDSYMQRTHHMQSTIPKNTIRERLCISKSSPKTTTYFISTFTFLVHTFTLLYIVKTHYTKLCTLHLYSRD